MVRFRHLLSGCALAAASVAGAQSPYPQPGYTNPFAPLSDADLLAQQLRVVAANPTDLYALINAANLSLKVGDTDAAAALFTRADRISPQHPRVKAGMARLLVQAGRPGDALRRFQEAQARGATLSDFGPDRALAYDLIGEQQRAQREYRALLRLGSDDETVRRYALSLGISGLKEPALAMLEPLNRRSDRGAWRARAFVLAMTGDRSGAERIATTMMPSGMAQGLAPFFDRLPRLGASERAFAVNFGETRASPTRLADARLAPSLPALSPEPNPFPVTRAPVQIVSRDEDDGKKRKKRKSKKDKAEPVRLARQPYSAPLPPPPAPTAAQLASLSSTRLPPAMTAYRDARVTVLPPPADAYRGPVMQTTPTAGPASRDEPDFAVEAVSTLAAASRPATTAPLPAANPVPPPVTLATAGPRTSVIGATTVSQPPPTSSPAATTFPAGARTSLAAAPTPGLGDFRLAGPAASPATVSPPPANPAPAPDNAIADLPATGAAVTTEAAPLPATPTATVAATQPAVMPPSSALAGVAAPTTGPSVDQSVTTPPLAIAAITPATGTPPPPKGARGDDVLAAIVAGIAVPETERVLTPAASRAASPPIGRTRLLANVEKKAEADKAKALVAKPDPTLPSKDARGRYIDTMGKPLLDARGRPLGPKAAAAWQIAQNDLAADVGSGKGKPDPSLPKKDARGRFVDAKGKPLLDARGRPLNAKAAATWQLAQADTDTAAKDKADSKLPKKDARGRFLDDKGKPLMDTRGRPMDAKAAAAWKTAEAKKAADAKGPDPAKGEPGRIWVQVAGGANEATLTKAWQQVSSQTPSLKGKQGWTTPLRGTNRVLTGPFKSAGEAMALVNQLKKEGVSGFMFTSDAGQKVTRLGAK